MESMKETAANIAASAKAGMEKTMATVQEKVEKMSAHNPVQKQMATEKKEERKAEAEWHKHEARQHNAIAKQAAKAGGHVPYTTTGVAPAAGSAGPTTGPGFETHPRTYRVVETPGYPTSTQQLSAIPDHGGDHHYGGHVNSYGIARTEPSWLPGDTTGHNPHV